MIRKLLLFSSILAISALSYAQSPYDDLFTTYQSSGSQSQQSQQPQRPQGQLMYGYINTSSGLKRIKIRVAEFNTMGVCSVYVMSYCNSTYGSSDYWQECRTPASRVSEYSDGTFISNNFEYKANLGGTTVYF